MRIFTGSEAIIPEMITEVNILEGNFIVEEGVSDKRDARRQRLHILYSAINGRVHSFRSVSSPKHRGAVFW